jgi:hypothetical protein
MKVDPNLTLIIAQETAGPGPRKASRVSRQTSSSGIELLISRENQQARQLDPSSLSEARILLKNVTGGLPGTPGETAADIHLLQSPCLVRLPKPLP